MFRDSEGNIEIVGHASEMAALTKLSLTHTLIVGPRSVGKRTMLEWKLSQLGISEVLRVYDLKSADMQQILTASREAVSGTRAILVRLDRMSRTTEEKFLKVVEDAPPGVVFMATSTYPPRDTVSSRFTKLTVNHLNPKQVAMILNRTGYDADTAVALVKRGPGTVKGAMNMGKASPFASLVVRALKCIEEGDEDTLDKLYSKWEDGHTEGIITWAQERITGRWRVFHEKDSGALGKGMAMRILMKVDRYDRPRYVVRSTLVSIVREDQR